MDIYMAGSTFTELNSWLQEKGYNKLLSQENDRREIKEWVNHRRQFNDFRSKLLIDSGAFSVHTQNTPEKIAKRGGKLLEVDVDEYIQYLNDNEDAFTIYAQVDTIPGSFGKPKTAEMKEAAAAASWQNYLYMCPRLKNKDKLLPIFHQGEDFKWLRNMLEYTDSEGKHIPYIGISPSNDVSANYKDQWLTIVYSEIAMSSNPNVKTHGFGITSLNLLEKYPFTSADSTSWIMTAVNGMIFSKNGPILLSRATQKQAKNFVNLLPENQKTILEYIEAMGYTYEELCDDYKQREFFNIEYMNRWAANYQYKGGDRVRRSLFQKLNDGII